MSFTCYLPAGFIHEPDAADPRLGRPEIALYNPAPQPCVAELTVYFSDRPPIALHPILVKAESTALLLMPDMAPDILRDAGFCGFRIAAPAPLVVNHINGVRHVVPAPQFSGGCASFQGRSLDTRWRIPDGLWLEWNIHLRGDLAKAPFPFNESELYHFLNPQPRDVEMEMMIHYRKQPPVIRRVTLPAQRVWVWDNLGAVEPVHGYTVYVTAGEPIVVEAVRNLYGLTGLDAWGMTVHCAMYAIPGPVPERNLPAAAR